MTDTQKREKTLTELVGLLDVPDSYYERAKARYQSLGRWFCRDGSSLKRFGPSVYPQGSFRLGTVVRPVFDCDEYDLDVVCELATTKGDVTQAAIKQLVGDEVKAYALAKGVEKPVIERKRCWRLDYKDEVKFHIDVLPCIPEDERTKAALRALGVSAEHAELAIALSCVTHSKYREKTAEWPTSNPSGYGHWFEDRMKSIANRYRLALAAVSESVEDIPTYKLRTPLQRAIQILKRHRDVMFNDDRELMPTSMLITSLSAQGYQGEESLYDATKNVLARMPGLVRPTKPRVPNPVNPGEDFADKWASDARLKNNFDHWHDQATRDLESLVTAGDADRLKRVASDAFDWMMSTEVSTELAGSSRPAPPTRYIPVKSSPPSPWSDR